jgi:hypothetical protein
MEMSLASIVATHLSSADLTMVKLQWFSDDHVCYSLSFILLATVLYSNLLLVPTVFR